MECFFLWNGRGGNVVLVQHTLHVISSIVLQLSIILRIISWFHGLCRNAVLTFTSICLTLVWSWAYNHISTDQSAFKGAFTQYNINLPPTQLLGFIALHVNKLIPQKFRPLSLSSLAILVSCL